MSQIIACSPLKLNCSILWLVLYIKNNQKIKLVTNITGELVTNIIGELWSKKQIYDSEFVIFFKRTRINWTKLELNSKTFNNELHTNSI